MSCDEPTSIEVASLVKEAVLVCDRNDLGTFALSEQTVLVAEGQSSAAALSASQGCRCLYAGVTWCRDGVGSGCLLQMACINSYITALLPRTPAKQTCFRPLIIPSFILPHTYSKSEYAPPPPGNCTHTCQGPPRCHLRRSCPHKQSPPPAPTHLETCPAGSGQAETSIPCLAGSLLLIC
jgi:hypothetical protein